VTRLLGHDDEPQEAGALVAVHAGDYRKQEVWVRSGANIGQWYPLGGESWVVWNRERMPPGVTKAHPHWEDVLARGPVTLLVAADEGAYRLGWRNGRHAMYEQINSEMESLTYDDPPNGGRSEQS
jgi:hypothetical protein